MNGLDAVHLRSYVVTPALMRMATRIPFSVAAVQLVTGTAIVESELRWLDQIDYQKKPGPAYGLWQMEGATFRDHLSRMADDLKPAVMGHMSQVPTVTDLYWNLRLGAQMCRLLYWHAPEPLPEAGDVEGMAKFWKLRYNTYRGAGTVEKAIPAFARACVNE